LALQEIFYLPQMQFKLEVSEISMILNFAFPSDSSMNPEEFMDFIIEDIGSFVSYKIK
jgi:hypothetical protein